MQSTHEAGMFECLDTLNGRNQVVREVLPRHDIGISEGMIRDDEASIRDAGVQRRQLAPLGLGEVQDHQIQLRMIFFARHGHVQIGPVGRLVVRHSRQ